MRRDIEQTAAEARQATHDLAAEIGADGQVVQDDIVNCIPGDKDSGKTLIYAIDVAADEGILARLPEIAARYEAEGWTPRLDDDRQLRLLRDPMALGVYLDREGSRASVQGSTGCVR